MWTIFNLLPDSLPLSLSLSVNSTADLPFRGAKKAVRDSEAKKFAREIGAKFYRANANSYSLLYDVLLSLSLSLSTILSQALQMFKEITISHLDSLREADEENKRSHLEMLLNEPLRLNYYLSWKEWRNEQDGVIGALNRSSWWDDLLLLGFRNEDNWEDTAEMCEW